VDLYGKQSTVVIGLFILRHGILLQSMGAT
jgi:hypothetical protein